MKVSGGRSTYGEVVGIIVMEKQFPRVPGDIGNATTFPFPVRFLDLKGFSGPEFAKRRQQVFSGDRSLLPMFIEAAADLADSGVRAITTNCGFLIMFQDEIAREVSVPVFTSSLLQLPVVHRMIGSDRKVGIITAQASALGEKHLEAAGAKHVPVVIGGMDDKEGHRPIRENLLELDPELMGRDLVDVAVTLLNNEPKIGAFILECANHPPWAHQIQLATGRPVFDLVTLTRWVHAAVVQTGYCGLL